MATPAYTATEVRRLLKKSKSGFRDALARGQLPFVVELLPRVGRRALYRADDIDRYLAGDYDATPARRFFHRHRKGAA